MVLPGEANRRTKNIKEKVGNRMSLGVSEKLHHVPRNPEGHTPVQGRHRSRKVLCVPHLLPVADIETLCRQEVSAKAEH